ncbi:MAG: tetratricopeptide repeat protein [Pseudomonadota bacterium]
MKRPLALSGEGFHFAWVKTALTLVLSLVLAAPVAAQTTPESDPDEGSGFIIEPPVELLPAPDLPPDVAGPKTTQPSNDDDVLGEGVDAIEPDEPDYSRFSAAEEREARLNDIFARLSLAETEDDGKLVAEEVWAIWMDSGSPSVNLILRRGAQAQTRGDNDLARRMFDHVTGLNPDYAEGWARSSRLALEERDFTRATGDAIRALTLEPRHFYALWTLGNVLERLGRADDALDAYREANRLYPTLESVSERVDALELQLDGGVL